MDTAPDIPLRLALHRVPGIGPATWARLCAHCGPPEAWLSAPEDLLRSVLSDTQWRALEATLRMDPCRVGGVALDLEWLSVPGRHLLLSDQADYPSRLAAIHQPPPLLFVRGDKAVLQVPQLAVVGTRYPTRQALADCHDFCVDLSRRGLVITSGLALGIDAMAHQAALETGNPTIAVLAHGLDTVYPPRHRQLADRIADAGALVSEFPVGVQPRPDAFPRRNRLISGLSLGVWVVEGALQSGSMITAREAMEQGRDVFALPGSVRNPLTRGCHRLIRQGALLVEQPEDIWSELGLLACHAQARPMDDGSGIAARGKADHSRQAAPLVSRDDHPDPRLASVLAYLEDDACCVDDLAVALGISVPETLACLGRLMIEGRVGIEAGRYRKLQHPGTLRD